MCSPNFSDDLCEKVWAGRELGHLAGQVVNGAQDDVVLLHDGGRHREGDHDPLFFFGLSSVMTAPDERGQFPDPTQHGKQGREGRLARLMANRHKLITYMMHTVYLFRIAGAWPLPCYMRLHTAQCT